MIYVIHIGDLSVNLIESENSQLHFGGKGFSFSTSPRTKILEYSPKTPHHKVGGFRARTSITLESLVVHEFPFDPSKLPQHQKLVFHEEVEESDSKRRLFFFELLSYWEELQAEKHVDLNVSTNRIQFNLDKKVWHRLLHFVSLSEVIKDVPTEIPISEDTAAKALDELEKFSIAKLYDTSNVNINV